MAIDSAQASWNRPRRRPPVRKAGERLGFNDYLIGVLLFIPIFENFYPLETYLAAGTSGGFSRLPFTPTMLVLISLSVIYLYLETIKRKKFRHNIAAYIFLGVAFASIFWSYNPQFTFQRSLRLLPAIGLGILLGQYYPLNRMLRMMVTVFMIAAVVGIVMSVVFPSLGQGRIGGAYESSWRGANIQKNVTGNLFAIGIIITFYAYLFKVISIRRAACAAFPSLIMLAMSQSGTAAVGMVAALSLSALLMVIRRFPQGLRPWMLISSTALIISLALMITLNLEEIFAFLGRDMTFTGRTSIWPTVWELISERPILGHAYGVWTMPISPLRTWATAVAGFDVAHSHNAWLDIWLQLGLVGLAAFLWMTLAALGASFRMFSATQNREALLYLSLLIYCLIRSVTEVQFSDPFLTALFWMSWIATSVREKQQWPTTIGAPARPRRMMRTAP